MRRRLNFSILLFVIHLCGHGARAVGKERKDSLTDQASMLGLSFVFSVSMIKFKLIIKYIANTQNYTSFVCQKFLVTLHHETTL